MEEAKGRAAFIFVSAPRSFDAATIFIALVILAVEVTDRRRSERDFSDGMSLREREAKRSGG